MSKQFNQIIYAWLILGLCISACEDEQHTIPWELSDNSLTGDGWTRASGNVRTVPTWHEQDVQLSLEGEDTSAVSKWLDFVPQSLSIVAKKDSNVSLSVAVEGLVPYCNETTVEGRYWTELSSEYPRICSEFFCGKSDEDGFCLVAQTIYPLRFSEDGIAQLKMPQSTLSTYFDEVEMIVVSIVKEGAGTAVLERIYL